MNPNDAAPSLVDPSLVASGSVALALADILEAENAALERHDPEAAVALIDRKLVVSRALAADDLDPELADRLRDLALRNRVLLERAIDIQGRIITMVARAAAQSVPVVARYGAEGRTLTSDTSVAITRHA